MKKIILILLTILFLGCKSNNDISLKIEGSLWLYPNRFYSVNFQDDSCYYINIPRGLGNVFHGSYSIINNVVTLNVPVIIDDSLSDNYHVKDAYETLFPTKESVEFILNCNYMDFYSMMRLESRNIYLYSTKPSPENNIYLLDDIEVIKSKGYLILNSNMKVRIKPTIESQYLSFDSHELFSDIDEVVNNNTTILEYLPRNLVLKYIAKSKKIESISETSSPWYYVEIHLGDDSIYKWLYGGYVTLLDEDEFEKNRMNYQSELLQYLIENNVALKQEM